VRVLGGSLAAALIWWSAVAVAQEATPHPPTALPPVLVTAPSIVSSSSEQLIPGKDFELRPEGQPADILRLVPGCPSICGATRTVRAMRICTS